MSKEHIPPSKAYNFGDYKVQSIDKYKTKDVNIWRTKKMQGGNYAYVICEECNNHTGQWYGGEYVKLVKTCAPYAKPDNAEQVTPITVPAIFPLRACKQALTILCTSSGIEAEREMEGITAPASDGSESLNINADISPAINHLPAIKNLILEKEATGLPHSLRLYMYLVASVAGRQTGVIKMWSKSTGASALFIEFAWSPLGWVLVFDGQIPQNLLDVTGWSQYKYNDEVTLTLDIPCLWLESKMPLDFRSPNNMAEARKRNQTIIDARYK